MQWFASLVVFAVRSHMRQFTANRALNIGRCPLLACTLRTAINGMRAATHTTSRLNAQGAIDRGQLAQLFRFVLPAASLDLIEQLLNHAGRTLQTLLVRRSDMNMQRLIIVGMHQTIRFVHTGALPTHRNLTASLFLHLLLSVSAWAHNQAEEIIVGKLVHRHHNLVRQFGCFIVWRRLIRRIQSQQLTNNGVALLLQFLLQAILASVDADACFLIVHWLWRW
mmetsp:Transcript_32174/g.52066  ORF Transcript_32174/g.52066 Transcript_32174/m.52066 type:complete len:223 (+) Transcript_32174:433-1101(+)